MKRSERVASCFAVKVVMIHVGSNLVTVIDWKKKSHDMMSNRGTKRFFPAAPLSLNQSRGVIYYGEKKPKKNLGDLIMMVHDIFVFMKA